MSQEEFPKTFKAMGSFNSKGDYESSFLHTLGLSTKMPNPSILFFLILIIEIHPASTGFDNISTEGMYL